MEMAKKALRVLAFAYRDILEWEKIQEDKDAEKNLVYIWLTWMIDPPRDEVKDAVAVAQKAGIRTIVITWDFWLTAGAIAEELGMIWPNDTNNIFTWEEIQAFSDWELKNILKQRKSLIFARTMPSDKMRIVSLLQDLWEVVAMTWDWVNDAPALKKADIWIAMWITWTEVSKESATMILMNDSFASIVTAIKEGRNLWKFKKIYLVYVFFKYLRTCNNYFFYNSFYSKCFNCDFDSLYKSLNRYFACDFDVSWTSWWRFDEQKTKRSQSSYFK